MEKARQHTHNSQVQVNRHCDSVAETHAMSHSAIRRQSHFASRSVDWQVRFRRSFLFLLQFLSDDVRCETRADFTLFSRNVHLSFISVCLHTLQPLVLRGIRQINCSSCKHNDLPTEPEHLAAVQRRTSAQKQVHEAEPCSRQQRNLFASKFDYGANCLQLACAKRHACAVIWPVAGRCSN